MGSLSSSARLGNTSASSLIRSASSIQNEINSYNDSLAAYQFELSPKTSGDLQTYQNYLSGRIKTLQNTGSVTDASKALSLTKTLTSAYRSSTSADIQRENIQIMSGNATLQDKYSTIVNQYQRALSVGDLSLAQQLESQAYSVSQSIQYQAQQAASAAQTLSSVKASEQGSVVSALDESVKQLNNDIAHLGVKDFNNVAGKWVDANRQTLQSLGVIIPQGAQPNYFNIVAGVQAAKYNALVLKAQAQAPYNPAAAQYTLAQAQNLQYGASKIDTLGGKLSIQEIQQAAQDPSMFAYDYGTGKYTRTAQTGYQYINGQLAPQYSGIVGNDKRNQIYFLNPNQTTQLTNLGLNFTMNKNGTTGDGVKVQLTDNSPDWLKSVLGQNGITNVFTDKYGNLNFEGASSTGNGLAYFSLMNVGGLNGLFEHNADGSTRLVGGNYGFDQGAAQLLINAGQIKQQQIQLQTKAEQAAQATQLKLATPAPLPQVKVAPPAPVRSTNPQQTVSTQSIQPTYNPQPATYNPQPATQVQSNVQGVPLYQPKLNGIKL